MSLFIILLLFLILLNFVLLLLSYRQQKKNPASKIETGSEFYNPVSSVSFHRHELHIKNEGCIRWYDPSRSGAAVSKV